MKKTKNFLPEKVGEINPAEYNPRKISDKSLHGLECSLETFGDLSCFVYNTKTKRLVCGHQRMKTIPSGSEIIITSREKDERGTVALGNIKHNGTLYQIRFVDWDDITEKAANISANNSAIQGEFIPEVNILLEEIYAQSEDLYRNLVLEEVEIEIEPEHGQSGNEENKDKTQGSSNTGFENFVKFQFGDHSGLVSKPVYESFKQTYEKFQSGGNPALDDVLREWLNV
ncbi:MAG: hypothetical protein KA807_17930 [Prolixibacteraceae bacterium]|nr:hypothetical protein [Prolixibacteraceae bacterium]